MKDYVREGLRMPELEPTEKFKIGIFTFGIFKNNNPVHSLAPYQIMVLEEDLEYWMDKGMRLTSTALCYYSILLFLQEHA